MAHRHQRQRDPHRAVPLQREHGVGGIAGEERACGIAAEGGAGYGGSAAQRAQTEAGKAQGMQYNPWRGERTFRNGAVGLDHGEHEADIGIVVLAEGECGGLHRALEYGGSRVVERMGNGGGGVNPGEAEALQRQSAE